jgi:hypothetical protein
VVRRTLSLTVALLPAALAPGCCLFPARPQPVPRPPHVVIVGADGLAPKAVDPARTPHLARMQQDGAYTWALEASEPKDRAAVYYEALTGAANGAASSILRRCREAGRGAVAVLRSWEGLERLAAEATRLPPDVNDPVAAGSYAASRFLTERPGCLFVELSDGTDPPAACDAGLGKVLAAVCRAGLADRTTVILLSATPRPAWIIRGPDTRHGYEIAEPVRAADTLRVAAELLGLRTEAEPSPGAASVFRSAAGQVRSEHERVVPRGSVRGTVRRRNGTPLPRATVLLVKDEPVDGIRERWADTDERGAFRFDSIPAGTYDYVFVFDNLPAQLRRSLLVDRAFAVPRDTTIEPELAYARPRGSDEAAAPVPPADTAAALLSDDQVGTLRRAARKALPVWAPAHGRGTPPLLAADALTGRRAHTSLIREWLLGAARELQGHLKAGRLDHAARDRMIDLAAAYDVNRASGLLDDTEERELRAALALAAELVCREAEPRPAESDSAPPELGRDLLRKDANIPLALAAAAGALGSSNLAPQWLDRAEARFAARLDALARRAEVAPAATNLEELCLVLEYAMVARTLDVGDHVGDRLERLVRLTAACLTPAGRGVGGEPLPRGLGFLGLAKSAYAYEPVGERLATLWESCGSPHWAPRGDESILGTLLTAGTRPGPRPLGEVGSRQLTETAAVLRHAWRRPEEWFIYVNGWSLDVHAGGARLATVATRPMNGRFTSRPHVLRCITSPGYDYLLLGGWVSLASQKRLAAYRHVWFNKLSGYVMVSDELPGGLAAASTLEPAGEAGKGALTGAKGLHARVLGLDTQVATKGGEVVATSRDRRPTVVVYPTDQKKPVTIGRWDVQVDNLGARGGTGYAGTHVVLRPGDTAEYVRLGRALAHVAGNEEDSMLEAVVAAVRRRAGATDLLLANGRWILGDRGEYFALEHGTGYATIRDPGGAEGWTSGRSREVTVSLGDRVPRAPRLWFDGRSRALERSNGRVTFYLPAGPLQFRVK